MLTIYGWQPCNGARAWAERSFSSRFAVPEAGLSRFHQANMAANELLPSVGSAGFSLESADSCEKL
eukprot:m.829886 g.829886  ORF g.829886 m.829886 type:complete len:66 (+) comp59450_c0_seq3:2538-2735(+)